MNAMTQMTIDTIDRQKSYVASQKAKGQGLGVVFADAFLRGMRDLGYKNPAWALAEMLDNSFQAAADTVEIRFGFNADNKSKTKPDMVAVIDNGNGMISEMIGYAVRWGGTDREGDRTGFGRYGYGLPSAAVSMAKRYSVYAKAKGKTNGQDIGWHKVTVDIDELAATAGDMQKTEQLLTATPAEVPDWVQKAAKNGDKIDVRTMSTGTIVVLEELDRLNRQTGWIKVDTLKTKLLQHFGVIYRHWIPERRITVDGVPSEAVDPLFLMEHGRFFDETSVHSHRVEARTIVAKMPNGATGTISVRASVLPPDFQLADPNALGKKGAKMNKRHEVMREYNGLLVCREKRQIDCIAPRWTKFQTYDANIKIEINFDATLDEYFGITTSKQQIEIDDSMWELLQQSGSTGAGLIDLVQDLRSRYELLLKDKKAKVENREKDAVEEPRASELAMEATEKFKGATTQPADEQIAEAESNLEREAKRRADDSGRKKEEVLQELKEETAKRRWELEFKLMEEGPFFIPTRLGMQKRVVINTDHPFFTKIYEPVPAVRPALEVMLFVLAERELEVKGDASTFYKAERNKWSERLRHALDTLQTDESMTDKAAAAAERLYLESADTGSGSQG